MKILSLAFVDGTSDITFLGPMTYAWVRYLAGNTPGGDTPPSHFSTQACEVPVIVVRFQPEFECVNAF
jgi:hypothetical protein